MSITLTSKNDLKLLSGTLYLLKVYQYGTGDAGGGDVAVGPDTLTGLFRQDDQVTLSGLFVQTTEATPPLTALAMYSNDWDALLPYSGIGDTVLHFLGAGTNNPLVNPVSGGAWVGNHGHHTQQLPFLLGKPLIANPRLWTKFSVNTLNATYAATWIFHIRREARLR